MSCCVDLSQRELVVVLIVENIHERGCEGVKIIKHWKLLEHRIELLDDAVFCEHDLSHVEFSDTCDLVARMDDGGCLSLRLAENNVEEVGCRWHRRDGWLEDGGHDGGGGEGGIKEG